MRRAALAVPLLAAAVLAGCTEDSGEQAASSSARTSSSTPSDSVPVLQPGKPGQPNTTLSGSDVPTKEPTHPADVRFMQHMIVHHGQAITMVNIVKGRLTDPQVRAMAGRIEAEQQPEMGYMTRWLRSRGQSAPTASPTATPTGHGDHGGHGGDMGHAQMPGMATPAQLDQLRRTSGPATDRLFLDLMIRHHGGAITMVGDRVKAGGADPGVEKFADDIQSAQGSQIRHMRAMLQRLGGAPTS